MKKTIKISAILLALIMAVSVFAISPISASAAADNERVLLTFDRSDERTSVTTNKSDTKPQIATVSGVDSSSSGGSGGSVAYNTAWGTMATVTLSIKLTPSWYENKPVAIKFWAMSTENYKTANLNAKLSNKAATAQSPLSPYDLSNQELSNAGAWYTINISNYTLDELKTFNYLELQSQQIQAQVNIYVDDVTLVYSKSSDVPAETEWKTIYDWEENTNGVSKTGEETFARENISSLNPNVAGSTYALRVKAKYNDNTDYISIVPTDEIKNAKDVRLSLYKATNEQYMYFGVKYNDVIYWSYKITGQQSFTWSYLTGMTLTSADKSTIVLDYNSVKDVQAILYSVNSDYVRFYLDDIQYKIEKTATGANASFTGADDTIADVANGGKFPTATISGKTFVGWSDGTNLYKAGTTIDIAENTTFKAVGVAFGTLEEASVRWSATDSMRGIKFTSYVNKADFDALAEVNGSSVALVGAVITDEDGKELDVSNDTSSNDVAPNWYSSDDVNYYFGSAATNFKGVDKSYLTKTLYAKMYLKVKYADGSEYTFTGTKTTEGRTMQGVAQKAYADANDAQKKVLVDVYKVTA